MSGEVSGHGAAGASRRGRARPVEIEALVERREREAVDEVAEGVLVGFEFFLPLDPWPVIGGAWRRAPDWPSPPLHSGMPVRLVPVIGARFSVDLAPSLAECGVAFHVTGRNDADTSSGES